jgi:hypothetical protein
MIQPYDIGRGGFVPSGWMGDGEKRDGFKVQMLCEEQPHSSPYCQRWEYHPIPLSKGGYGWGAVAWQFPANNWGDKPGRDLSDRGFREVSVWARGVPDSESHFPVVQFKAGGNTDPSKAYQASFEVEGEFVTLKGEWVRYTIRLPDAAKRLKSVISAFAFVVRAEDHPNGATFFLDDIEYR